MRLIWRLGDNSVGGCPKSTDVVSHTCLLGREGHEARTKEGYNKWYIDIYNIVLNINIILFSLLRYFNF